MAFGPLLLFFLSLVGCCSAKDKSDKAPPPPRGCGSGVDPTYRVLCDLESVWGVVLEAVASGGVIAALVLALILLVRLKTVTEPSRRSGVGPLLLLLAGTVGLFGLSLVFMVGRSEILCMVRRCLWGLLFGLCFSCLLVQGLRLRRLARGKSSPAGSSLSGLALGLTLVQGIVSAEWLLLTVAREGHAACDYQPVDFALACSYVLGLLLTAAGLALAVALCGGGTGAEPRWRCNGVWLFLTCLASLLLWVIWLVLYLYGSLTVTTGPRWDEPALAITLVTEGWALLLFHAIPETHLCLRTPARQSSVTMAMTRVPDYYDTSHQPPPPMHMGEQGYDSELPSSPGAAFPENHAYSIEGHNTAVRTSGYTNGQGGVRTGLPFRSHVYQPTEMALLMNGGTIPTAPPNFTGRQLW
ncbi:G protein-coupled receptor, class C, group 5, member Bb [Chanos chanos]|uniref:G protein-coupled receptor, class C, group 5, member Bb n=1 Tax=Chanos chanos TaxID=29144 RepID=A0A6J2VXS8_CHACN|nr:G-protein coupled receptor family C group 5 member B-like [Chanos chanos]